MDHKAVSKQEWLAARKELLVREKEFTRLRELSQPAAQRSPLGKGSTSPDLVTPVHPVVAPAFTLCFR